jgi:hypothetical protein
MRRIIPHRRLAVPIGIVEIFKSVKRRSDARCHVAIPPAYPA